MIRGEIMNDEIREILDKLKDDDWYDELDLTGDKWIELKQTETNKILDYITNLQQENHELKSKLECYENGAYYSSKVDELEQENERLKKLCKEWKENHKAVCIQRDNILDNIVKDTEKRIDYKSRCDKAVEYIKNDWYSKNTVNIDNVVIGNWRIDLLNILQNGSDK